jgi:hypothetical protein
LVSTSSEVRQRMASHLLDGSQVGVFEQGDEVSLGSLLQSHNSGRLESQVGLEVLSDFSNQSLERKLSDQELGGLLVLSDFSESDGTGPVPVGLLDTTGGRRCGLSGSLGSELLSGSLTTGRLSCCLPGGNGRRSWSALHNVVK